MLIDRVVDKCKAIVILNTIVAQYKIDQRKLVFSMEQVFLQWSKFFFSMEQVIFLS